MCVPACMEKWKIDLQSTSTSGLQRNPTKIYWKYFKRYFWCLHRGSDGLQVKRPGTHSLSVGSRLRILKKTNKYTFGFESATPPLNPQYGKKWSSKISGTGFFFFCATFFEKRAVSLFPVVFRGGKKISCGICFSKRRTQEKDFKIEKGHSCYRNGLFCKHQKLRSVLRRVD